MSQSTNASCHELLEQQNDCFLPSKDGVIHLGIDTTPSHSGSSNFSSTNRLVHIFPTLKNNNLQTTDSNKSNENKMISCNTNMEINYVLENQITTSTKSIENQANIDSLINNTNYSNEGITFTKSTTTNDLVRANSRSATKPKVSRERQLKINAASRKCRKKQKMELQFLRSHVAELQIILQKQLQQTNDPNVANVLENVLMGSRKRVEEVCAVGKIYPASSPDTLSSSFIPLNSRVLDDKAMDEHINSSNVMSAERKSKLLSIASFILANITMESACLCPESISVLPIDVDGWQLRLAITEKNYTMHNTKFFPYKLEDMYNFCWETNVTKKKKFKHSVITSLGPNVAHVDSKTVGKWSLSVHGVPNVRYISLLCRQFKDGKGMICQQSVLNDCDFDDEETLPWLFKRWVSFRSHVRDSVSGTIVEAFRTASYATGRQIYKEDSAYESFCEHLIKRYAESTAELEIMMRKDQRFRSSLYNDSSNTNNSVDMELNADHTMKELLLF